jgi:hypothetical protein
MAKKKGFGLKQAYYPSKSPFGGKPLDSKKKKKKGFK